MALSRSSMPAIQDSTFKTPNSKKIKAYSTSSPSTVTPSPMEKRLYEENDLLGALLFQLRGERDSERKLRLAAEQRERDIISKYDNQTQNLQDSLRSEKAKEVEVREEAEVREELEKLALDLQDEADQYKRKAESYDNVVEQLEAERNRCLLMEEIVASSPEGGHIAMLMEKCEDAQARTREAEEVARECNEAHLKLQKETQALRKEAANREALLEQEIDLSRAAEEEEVMRLRNRIKDLELTTNSNTENSKIKKTTSSPGQQKVLASTTTEMHLHALALIRDRSRLLRRLHRAETDVMLLRAENSKLESSLISGSEVLRTNNLIKAAKTLAIELGTALPQTVNNTSLDGSDDVLSKIRSLFLLESPSNPLPSLPSTTLVTYTRSLENALIQCRADCVSMRKKSEECCTKEKEMASMLQEATEREANGVELLRIEISRAKEAERQYQESLREIQFLEEAKFQHQQEAWRLRDILAESGITSYNE